MQTIEQVKEFLDELRKEALFPGIARLVTPGIIEEIDCQRIEKELSIQLPESYRSVLLEYDLRSAEFQAMSFFASARAIIRLNKGSINPFFEFYKENHLLEIGNYEADRLCIRLEEYGESEGEIVYISHAKYPRPEQAKVEFVSSDFEKLIVCAAIDLKLKKEMGYDLSDDWIGSEKQKALSQQIMDEILKIEPQANESFFWHYFIGGF